MNIESFIRNELEYRFNRIRFLKDELKTAYKNELPEIEREIFTLSVELMDEVDNLKRISEELNEEINLVNKIEV